MTFEEIKILPEQLDTTSLWPANQKSLGSQTLTVQQTGSDFLAWRPVEAGSRLGIVLPEGVFNNPSLVYISEFCEDRAFIRAVASLPPETFVSSGAS